MIKGTGVTKKYSNTPVIENIDFKIGNGVKVGIVGRNGSGKSTLIKIIAGTLQLDSGSILKENEVIGYIPQEFSFKNEMVGEFLEKLLDTSWEQYKIDTLLNKLNFLNYDQYQQINTLSEGQKMKLKMVQVLLNDPTTLLIDEPTNHLDIEGIIWFEKFIKDLKISVLMISHDRQFLNNTVDEIWEIEDKSLYRFVGDYDSYKQEKLKLINKWDEEYIRFVKRRNQLESLLKRARTMNISRSGKGVQSVKNRINREIEKNEKKKYDTTKTESVSFDTDITSRKLMVRFKGVCKSYETTHVFTDLNFEVRGGEKIWLYGPNGAGKSTLVKMIVGEGQANSGEVKVGENIKLGYFAQKQTHLDFNKNLQTYFIEQTGCSHHESFGLLKKFVFLKEDLVKPIKQLSPGQRARFAFAVFAYNNYDLLILDEPTNHLDIETKEVIEESLKNYKGTLLLVSHDRFFVERVGIEKILNLKQGKLNYF